MMEKKLLDSLRASTMFRFCSEEQRKMILKKMKRVDFKRGDVLALQGEPTNRSLFLVEGKVVRHRLIDDQLHEVGTLGAASSWSTIGMLHLIKRDPGYATVKAVTPGTLYVLDAKDFDQIILEQPDMTKEIIYSLCREVRSQHNHAITPLFLQKGKEIKAEPLPMFAITCAAGIESFYRSALNALINAQLTGKRGNFFPNMHIQVPTRILYINGFKGIRHTLDNNIDLNEFENPQAAGLGLAVVPGLVMSPVSSLLEASNAGHMNKEPIIMRWTRGLAPRCLREVIFGIGINQLSDFYEERLEFIPSQTYRNMAGSFMAGIVSGYLSHVPHNLSALKLLNPAVSYAEHFKSLATTWELKLNSLIGSQTISEPNNPSPTTTAPPSTGIRRLGVYALCCLFPKGVLIRSAQISGSFIVINTTINALKHISVEVKTNND